MKKEYSTLEKVQEYITERLNATQYSKISVLFASNTSGKTRLSKLYCDIDEESENKTVLCYNAFLEDMFQWDNEKLIFKISEYSWVSNLIQVEGLEDKIINTFKALTNSKIEPKFDLPKEQIVFGFTEINNELEPIFTRIKISRGEESLFLWAVFYTILSFALDCLSENKEDRSTQYFDNIRYIVIDDPVSSMDDTRIITIALSLADILNKLVNIQDKLEHKLKVLITTHHALFFNIIHGKDKGKWKQEDFVMSKQNDAYIIDEQKSGATFAYHNVILSEIKKAVDNDNLEKYHFNLFRCLVEKTANFLGYQGHWSQMLSDYKDNDEIVKLLDHYSHGQLSDIEPNVIESKDKELFADTFNRFIRDYKWNYKED